MKPSFTLSKAGNVQKDYLVRAAIVILLAERDRLPKIPYLSPSNHSENLRFRGARRWNAIVRTLQIERTVQIERTLQIVCTVQIVSKEVAERKQ